MSHRLGLTRLRRAVARRIAGHAVSSPAIESERGLEDVQRRLVSIEAKLAAIERAQPLVRAIARRLFLSDLDLPAPYNLTAQRFGMTSQNEEDGLVVALFKGVGITDRRLVEIGCGLNGGNSALLVRECGWNGLMVDADGIIIKRVRQRFDGLPVTVLRRKVTAESINGLLAKFGCAGDVDFLSIDIDGSDYWIWKALDVCRPRVVAIEYNYLFGSKASVTIPYESDFNLSSMPTRAYRGASLRALVHLGRRKGYRLVAGERINAFFVRDGLAPEITAVEAERVYRPPRNRLLDVFGKIAHHHLPLVAVSEAGEQEPAVLNSRQGEEQEPS